VHWSILILSESVHDDKEKELEIMRLVHSVKAHKKHTWGALPNRSSGVDVQSSTRSISFASTFAISIAFRDDSTARLVIVSPSDYHKGNGIV
jgi:hypothetical protein